MASLLAKSRFARAVTLGVPFLLTTGGSLFSRFSSFVVLVVSARALELSSFGFFATAVALSIGAANTLTIGAGDMIAATAVRSPKRLLRLVQALGFLTFVALCVVVTASSLGAHYARWIALVCLLIATAASMVFMQMCLGASGPSAASLVGYYLPSLARLGIIFLPASDASLDGLLALIAVLAAVAALLGAATAYSSLRRSVAFDAGSSSGRLHVAVLVGLAWLFLNQADVTSVTLILGLDAGGSFTPIVRIFEALGAFAIAAKFLAARATFAGRPTFRRTALLTVGMYIPFGIAFIYLGRKLAEFMLGAEAHWDNFSATVLCLAYLALSVSSVALQILVAERRWRYLTIVLLITVALSALLTPTFTFWFGIHGAVVADLVVYTAWAIFLVWPIEGRATKWQLS